jgi:hypothetical protein
LEKYSKFKYLIFFFSLDIVSLFSAQTASQSIFFAVGRMLYLQRACFFVFALFKIFLCFISYFPGLSMTWIAEMMSAKAEK